MIMITIQLCMRTNILLFIQYIITAYKPIA